MLEIPRSVIVEYRKWHKNWDDLCYRCGKCCHTSHYTQAGDIIVDYSDPCDYLDPLTHYCTVYKDRFRTYRDCGKVNLFRALWSPFLPPSCAYVKTFRPLLHKNLGDEPK